MVSVSEVLVAVSVYHLVCFKVNRKYFHILFTQVAHCEKTRGLHDYIPTLVLNLYFLGRLFI